MDTIFKGLPFKFDCKPDFGYLTINVPKGETVKVEAAAMAGMDTNMEMKTKFKGGFQRFLSGESLFINEFTAKNGNAEIQIAPASPGDIDHVYLDNESIYLQNSAFVASGSQIDVQSKWQGFTRGFFSGENFFLIKCTGKGDVWFNSYGGIIPIEVNGSYVVDTGHIVAFTEGLDYSISSVGGYKSLFLFGRRFGLSFLRHRTCLDSNTKIATFPVLVIPFPTK